MITKEEFDFLYDENITKKQYDIIINKINEKFIEICKKFFKLHKNSWFDYDNCNQDSPGFFNPKEYQEYISVYGECITPPIGYNYKIPTRWLWEPNWEQEMKNTINEATVKKEKLKKLKEIEMKKKELLVQNIKSKLTEEELKLIKFK